MVVNTLQVRFIVRLAYARREITPWSHLTMLFGSQAVMGFIGALLGATLLLVEPGAIPLVAMVFVIGHMSFASYSALREAHLATLRGMVKSLEAKDVYTRGHTERVARFVQMIAEELGFSGTRIERLRWAALIHDVGKLAVPKALIGKKGRLSDEETAEMRRHAHIVEEILAEVEFLQPMVEIASGHHSHFDGNGYGGRGHRHGQTPELDTCILSVADAFDAMTSSRSYRVALSQRFALRELSENSGTQFHPYVVDAFERALNKAGEEWGSSRVDDEEAARRLAEQREEFPLLYG
jgi:putative nucleotidyltransferase with HDIG domain